MAILESTPGNALTWTCLTDTVSDLGSSALDMGVSYLASVKVCRNMLCR